MRLARWSDIPLRTKGLIVVAAPAAATVFIACAAYRIGLATERAESGVNQAIESTAMIRELIADEVSASAAMRGLLLSGDERLTSRIRESIAAFQATSQELAGLLADSQVQRTRLKAIEELQRKRTEAIFVDLAKFRAGMLLVEGRREGVLKSEHERGEMEALIATMLVEEKRVLDQRTARVQSLRSRLTAVIGICAFGGVTGGSIIWMLFASGITARIARLKRNVGKLAAGAPLDSSSNGRDEIGSLNEGLVAAAEVLRTKTNALENALQGIAQADSSGRLISFNRACAELLGQKEGSSLLEFVPLIRLEDRARVAEALRSAPDAGRTEVEASICRPDGSIIDALIMFMPLFAASSEPGLHVFLRDITCQRKAEDALIRARDAALASNRAKTEFLAKISHDIRTPLNAILGSADLLAQTPLNADQSEYVGLFQRNSRRLVALINDFLDFARIEAGAVRVDRAEFRLRQIVDDVVRTFSESASRKAVSLTVDIGCAVPDCLTGDALRIQQVLSNLMSNALKFTTKGLVNVRILVDASGGEEFLRFEVADSGPGISPSDQRKIFAPFTQLPNQPPMSSVKGSGLGLAICRELVQLMGGEIGIESEPGVGSVFHFTVPLERSQLSSAPPASSACGRSEPGLLSPLRILVAEDAEDNRALVRHYLRSQPLDLRFVENGEQAVNSVIGGEGYDLILMDMDMPVMDGHTAVCTIRQWEADFSKMPVPIVALSAHAIVEEVRRCLDEGCAAHVAKPVDQVTLVETIRRYSRARPSPVLAPLHEKIKVLVPGYLGSKTRQIEEAFQNLSTGSFDRIRRFGHNLKGTGSGYGFPEIEEAGRRIEKSALEADEEEIARQLCALREVVNGASRALAD